jgi:glycosyltransferase involved in cell wall biosynthesis
VNECPTRVSIVVATKDRYETLFDCINSLLLNYDRDDVEIVVRDNSAQPRSDDFAARFGGRRNVVYRHDPTPVSQSENYELGVALARGDFVTMIGDDDGVAGGLLEIAAWMDRHTLDAFFPGFSVYLWPGVSGRLSFGNPDGWLSQGAWSAARLVDAERQRRAVLASGSTSLEELPRMYYGLVRRNCLDRVRDQAGACFPGPSPDMANAFALSYAVKRMAVAELPLFIAGNSRKSNAGLGLQGQHVGEIPDLPFLPRDTAARWNPCIPYFWSGQTIWCQSAYAAAAALGRAQEFEAANDYRALYARVLVFHPRFSVRLLRAFSVRHARRGALRMGLEAAATVLAAGSLWVARVTGFVQRRLRVRGGPVADSLQATSVPSVVDATRRVDAAMGATDLGAWLDRGLQVADGSSV